MTDQPTSAPPERCPWCSSDRGTDAIGRCLSCGAALIADETAETVPGVTDIDTLGIIRQRTAKQPNRIVAWVTGDGPEPDAWAPAGEALDQPSLEVQREMLRLQFSAAIAAQQAEVDALRAELALEAAEKSGQARIVEPVASADAEGDAASGQDAEVPPGPDAEPTAAGDGPDSTEESSEA